MQLQTVRPTQKKDTNEMSFTVMMHTFEELYNRKLEPSQVALWKKFLLIDNHYPDRYFVKVVELAGELKFFPKVAEVIERMDEYARDDGMRITKLSEPVDYHKETARKWMAQINTILSYGGLLKGDFDYTKLGRLYTPEQLIELLNNNLREGETPPDKKERSNND